MFGPRTRSHRPDSPLMIFLRPAQHLDAHDEVPRHRDVRRQHRGAAPDQIRSLAAHALLDLERLFPDPLPPIGKMIDMKMHIPQPIIMIRRVLIVDPSLERKAAFRHIGDDPFAIPDRIRRAPHGGRSEPHARILFVPRSQIGVELYENVWVGGERTEISHGQADGAVEGEFEREARRRARDGGCVMAAGRWGFLRFVALVANFLFDGAGFIEEFGCEGVGVMDIRYWRSFFLVTVVGVIVVLHEEDGLTPG